ncbi:MAG TPA: murein biosynthesis integral membrane protein MurJ [Polyangiaceae bacterium]|nr:murein biosynthesis integral membrane protein MurJ [Polyangiaceae bacterium]
MNTTALTPSRPSGEEERRALPGRAGIVGAGTLVSRILGLVRETVMAAIFSRAETDAFWVAFTLPNALRSLLGEGAASAAVVPVLAKVRAEEGDDAARRFFAAIRGVSLVALVVVTVLGIVGAPWLVELFAGGMHARPGAFERTVLLTRWVFPYIFFMGTAALGMAALNSYGRFAAAAFAPGLLNIAFVVACLLLPAWFVAAGQDRILALAAGVLVGGALQVIAQWPSLRHIGFASRPIFDFSNRRVLDALGRMVPMMAGIGIYAIDLMLSRRFLSQLPEGSQSYFSWAMRLCDFPQGIFVLALQAATLPALAKLVASGQLDEVAKTYAYGMRLSLFVAIPATALFVALARPIVVSIFERGAFDAVASTETAHALVAQGFGLWTVAAVRQIVPVFYALGDTRTPVVISAIDLVVFVVAALVLRSMFGHVGVSMAVTLSSAAQMLLLWFGLGRRLPSLRLGEIAASAARTCFASVVAGIAGYATAEFVARIGGGGVWARALPGVAGAIVFATAFIVVAYCAKSSELRSLETTLRKRLGRS